jgi:hypothetical protein
MNCIDAREALTNILDVTKEGYVRVGKMKRGVRRKKRAHRLIWEECFGPIPEAMFVLHKCDNPSCVNPDHLFLGTHKDNIRDMVSKGRGVDNRGIRHGMSKLTEDDVRAIRASTEPGPVLCRRYGVVKSTISVIRSKKAWGHLK